MSCSYKLFYFNGRGRAEVIRLLFAAACQDYQDARIDPCDWPIVKPNTPFEQLPILLVQKDCCNGLVIAQTNAIARFLAKKFNLGGKNETDEALCDMYSDQIRDLIDDLVKAYLEKDDQIKCSLKKKLATQTWPKNLKFFENRLTRNGTGYIVGKEMTWTDLYLFSALEMLGDSKDLILKNYPKISMLDAKIKADPRIESWISRRPETEF